MGYVIILRFVTVYRWCVSAHCRSPNSSAFSSYRIISMRGLDQPCRPRPTVGSIRPSQRQGRAVLWAPKAMASVGLSAISLVNYACKGLCTTHLLFTWRTYEACLGEARLNYSWRYVRYASSHASRPPGAEGAERVCSFLTAHQHKKAI